MDAVGCHTRLSVLISMSVFNVFHIPRNGCTQICIECITPNCTPTPDCEHASGDRYLTQLSGLLNALFALSSEKDTPGSFYIESGLCRKAVSSPHA